MYLINSIRSIFFFTYATNETGPLNTENVELIVSGVSEYTCIRYLLFIIIFLCRHILFILISKNNKERNSLPKEKEIFLNI